MLIATNCYAFGSTLLVTSFLYTRSFIIFLFIQTILISKVFAHIPLSSSSTTCGTWFNDLKTFFAFLQYLHYQKGKIRKSEKKRRWNIQLKNKYKLFSLHMQAILLKSFIGFKFTSLTGGNIHKIRIHTSCIQQNFNLIITA